MIENINSYEMGMEAYYIIQWFFLYSILGWLVETIYMSFCGRRFVNRGFAFGPICPIYGFGALGVYFILKPIAGSYVLLYIFGSLLATMFEFMVAKLMIHIFGEVWWDYEDKPFNYKGILCLESTLAWGLYTVVLFAFLQKNIMFISKMYPYKIGSAVSILLLIYYVLDFSIHFCKEKYPEFPQKAREFRRKLIK